MKLKTIFLGSAATLLATASIAFAAESAKPIHHKLHKHIVTKTVTTKKVPVVKNACSAFGPNLIKIPGTLSCLKIYGQVSGVVFGGSTLSPSYLSNEKANEGHLGLGSQGRIGVDAYAPSHLGPLHAHLELRGSLNNGLGIINYSAMHSRFPHDPNPVPAYEVNYLNGDNYHTMIHYAYAELGGLRFGIDHSIFNYWANNFGTVENDNILNSMAYTPLNAISYNFTTNKGISAIVGLESSDRKYAHSYIANDYNTSLKNTNYPEAASIVAGVKATQKWGDVIALAAYDGFFEKTSAKVRVDGSVNNRLNLFGLAAIKSIKDTYAFPLTYRDDAPPTIKDKDYSHFTRINSWSRYGDWDGKWEAILGGSYLVSPQVMFNAQLGYTAAKTAEASANFVYSLANNFTVTPELAYISWNDDKSFVADKSHSTTTSTNVLKGKHEVQALLKLCYKF